MTTLREAAQQLLEALDKSLYMNDYCGLEVSKHDQPDVTDAIENLRAALAEPVQEPAPMPPFPPVSQWKRGCAVCGLGADGKAYGYACPRSDCPTRVTCGGTV